MKEVQNNLKIETTIYISDGKIKTKAGIVNFHCTEATHCIVLKKLY